MPLDLLAASVGGLRGPTSAMCDIRPRPKRRPMTADERRLLELLAGSADGSTDAGLATVHCDRAVKITRVWITDAGRRALAERG